MIDEKSTRAQQKRLVDPRVEMSYGDCMAAKLTTTVRLDAEDADALARARAEGHSASELIRKGLRIAAARYYKRRRPPTTGLFVSTSLKLGDESDLFAELDR